MNRTVIEPGSIEVSGNSNFSLSHDVTNLVTFKEGMSNPLPEGQCFALYFHGLKVGICVQPTECTVALTSRGVIMFELGEDELKGFMIPAEWSLPTSVGRDWKTPLTKHLIVNHLKPSITISPADDNDHIMVKVEFNQNTNVRTITTKLSIRH